MAAYRRVYDSGHLQADCQEPGSAPEPYAPYSSMGYLFLLTGHLIRRIRIGCMRIFIARRYASVVYAMGLCQCVSVCSSVCHKSAFYQNS